MNINELELFLRCKKIKASFREENGCYISTSHMSSHRYVNIKYRKSNRKLHRLLYFMLYPDTEESMVIRHLCNNTKCCNPAHLISGTQADNASDTVHSGRCNLAKLSPEQVKDIRTRDIINKHEIAKEFGISIVSLRLILNNRTHKERKEDGRLQTTKSQ